MASRATILCSVLFIWKYGGNSVGLKGSWDGWKSVALMQKQADGSWSYVRPLLPGYYEYKYVVDGVHREDPAQPTSGESPFVNNSLEVMPPIRIKLHGLRTKRGPPFAFQVDPMTCMQTILTEAKALCRLPESSELGFALQDGTTLHRVEDFREDDHVYLDPPEDSGVVSIQSDLAQLHLKPDQVALVCTSEALLPSQTFDSVQDAVRFVQQSQQKGDTKSYRLVRAQASDIQINSVWTQRDPGNKRHFLHATVRGLPLQGLPQPPVQLKLQMDTAADLSVLST